MEATECGAASLAAILKYYGKSVAIEDLRRQCGVSRNGVNAKSIVRAAQYHGLKTRALRVNIEGAKKLRTPAVIHWNMDHFLVLCGFGKRGAVLADPAFGLRTVSMEEFSRSFTGIAIEMEPSEKFERGGEIKSSYIKECVAEVAPAVVFLLLLDACIIIGSTVLMFAGTAFIDKVLIGSNAQGLSVIIKAMLCAGVLAASAMAFTENIRYRIAKRLNLSINSQFIERLLHVPADFFSQRSAGDLSCRQNAGMLMGENISRLMMPVPGYVLQTVSYITITALIDSQAAAIGIAAAAVNIAAIIISSRRHAEKMRSLIRDKGALQSDISRAVDMIETVKACGAEESMFARLTAAGTQMLNTKTEIDRDGVYTSALFTLLNSFAAGAVLIAGAWKIISGSMTAGVLITSQALIAAMLSPVGKAAGAGIELQATRGEAARMDDVMNYDEDRMFSETVQHGAIDGDVELKNVGFSYDPLGAPFIIGFDLKIKKGGNVAITGGSGSGKSTAAKLIAGLYREDSGSVTFNGNKLSDIDREYFYSEIAVVSQNIRLFSGTVYENITMWDDGIAYEDVVAAAKAACIHEDIISRRGGYRAEVTENGENFSGGQRQRIEIARALVKKPSIIILDEATSALDTDTEDRVMNNIKALGITSIVVAHRLSSIIDSDEIIVMNGGKIVERGTHDELMDMHGEYYSLVRSVIR